MNAHPATAADRHLLTKGRLLVGKLLSCCDNWYSMWEVPKVGEGTSHIEYQIRRDNRYSSCQYSKWGRTLAS
eukprot:scaffold13253_cov87-Skeletonema_menzelii.AAC.1